ncbi:MAG TPA: ATP-binding protein [Blastocatellia bacterium]|nr:ATP-binding protein [Blastocatellia bacterium]
MQDSKKSFIKNWKRTVAFRKPSFSKTVSSAREPDIFGDSLADKPEHADLDTILPFLSERIAFDMPSDLKYLDSVLDYLNERMLKFGIINPGETEVLIAIDEAIVNAVKHGNKCDRRKAVHIVAEFNSDGARFTITDEGQGFCRDKVPDPTDPCRLLEPNGRGLLLINHIMDRVCYNEKGNQVEMFKRAIPRLQHVERPASRD